MSGGPGQFDHVAGGVAEQDLLAAGSLDDVVAELWTRPQPSGTRASDALDWARTILARYEGAGAPPTVLTANPEHSWRWGESNPRLPDS